MLIARLLVSFTSLRGPLTAAKASKLTSVSVSLNAQRKMTARTTRSGARAASQPSPTKTLDAAASQPAAPRGRKRKALVLEDDAEAPTVPTKSTTRASRKKSPASSTVDLIAEPVPGGPATLKPKPRAVSRLAEPNATHATVVSPETFQVIKTETVDGTGSSSGSSARGDVLEEACRHLVSVDPRMKRLIDKHHCRIFSAEGLAEKIDPFESLVSSMISQLISGAAARTIKARFIELFADPGSPAETPFPRPSAVAKCPVERLRTAGLSQRKAEWIQGLAGKFVSGELSAKKMAEAPYEELFKTLLAVPGLGAWTVEMFSCFALKRLDVFSLGDLGVQRGMAAFVGRDVNKLKSKGGKWKYMSQQEMKDISAKFAPYRSVFMWYMWRVEETGISTLES